MIAMSRATSANDRQNMPGSIESVAYCSCHLRAFLSFPLGSTIVPATTDASIMTRQTLTRAVRPITQNESEAG